MARNAQNLYSEPSISNPSSVKQTEKWRSLHRSVLRGGGEVFTQRQVRGKCLGNVVIVITTKMMRAATSLVVPSPLLPTGRASMPHARACVDTEGRAVNSTGPGGQVCLHRWSHLTAGRLFMRVSFQRLPVLSQHLYSIKVPLHPIRKQSCPWLSGLQLWPVLDGLSILGGGPRRLLRWWTRCRCLSLEKLGAGTDLQDGQCWAGGSARRGRDPSQGQG